MVAKVASAFTILEEPLNTSDHNPVFAVLRSCNLLLVPPSGASPHPRSHPSHLRNWSKTSAVRIRQLYITPLQQHMKHFLDDMPSESILFTRPDLIDSVLHSLTSLLLSSSLRIPSKAFHPHRVPG